MQEDSLFVVTWNLLAPIFVRPNNDPNDFAYFGHCSINDLSWDRRRLTIEEKIRELNPDVLLLQGGGRKFNLGKCLRMTDAEVEMEKNQNGKWDVPLWLTQMFHGWRIQGCDQEERIFFFFP
jgi:hypothetical protein